VEMRARTRAIDREIERLRDRARESGRETTRDRKRQHERERKTCCVFWTCWTEANRKKPERRELIPRNHAGTRCKRQNLCQLQARFEITLRHCISRISGAPCPCPTRFPFICTCFCLAATDRLSIVLAVSDLTITNIMDY